MAYALLALDGIGSLVCLVMVLIPLFKKEGAGLGILGIFCAIYTYIWGWINVKQFNLKNIMFAWTACIILSIIGNVLFTKQVADVIQEELKKQQSQQAR